MGDRRFRQAHPRRPVRGTELISENGEVKVEKVVESSHREFEASAIRFAQSCLYESPKKNGRAVRARYSWNIRFEP